eukprot:scaffold222649_cov30-Tisochrysis_lutea.AAC.1
MTRKGRKRWRHPAPSSGACENVLTLGTQVVQPVPMCGIGRAHWAIASGIADRYNKFDSFTVSFAGGSNHPSSESGRSAARPTPSCCVKVTTPCISMASMEGAVCKTPRSSGAVGTGLSARPATAERITFQTSPAAQMYGTCHSGAMNAN